MTAHAEARDPDLWIDDDGDWRDNRGNYAPGDTTVSEEEGRAAYHRAVAEFHEKVAAEIRHEPSAPGKYRPIPHHFSGIDWRAMYEEASRERDEAEREHDERVSHIEVLTRERDSWRVRAEDAEYKYGTESLRWERAREHHADESRKWGEKRRAYEARIAELEAATPDPDPAVCVEVEDQHHPDQMHEAGKFIRRSQQ